MRQIDVSKYLVGYLYILLYGASRLVASLLQTQWYFSALLLALRALPRPSSALAPDPDSHPLFDNRMPSER